MCFTFCTLQLKRDKSLRLDACFGIQLSHGRVILRTLLAAIVSVVCNPNLSKDVADTHGAVPDVFMLTCNTMQNGSAKITGVQ